MNEVILSGRLTADPNILENVAKYNLAVDRSNGEADFISCVCFGKQKDFANNYLHKGMKIIVEGRLQTGSFVNKDGQKVKTTDVIVNRHEFCESKGQSNSVPDLGNFTEIPEGNSEVLPFD